MARILLVGAGALGSIENSYKRALSRLGARVDLFDVEKYRIGRLGGNALRRVIVKSLASMSRMRVAHAFGEYAKARGHEYDVVVVFKGMDFSPDILRRARARCPNALWCNINPDDPFNIRSPGSSNEDVVAAIPIFDLYCIWSESLVGRLRSAGSPRAEYLPFAYDAEAHRPPREPAVRRHDVCFVGGWDPAREGFLAAIGERDIVVVGRGWDRVARGSPLRKKIVAANIYGQELASVISGARLSINILRPQNRGSHNMRTFEIPAIGGLMVTTRSCEQERFFPEGIASLMFSSPEELCSCVRGALNRSDVDLQDLRSAGLARAEGQSYDDRAAALLRMVRRR